MSYFLKMEMSVKDESVIIKDYLKSLTDEEVESMRNEISKWGVVELVQLTTMINDIFKINVSINFAQELMKKDLELACEEFLGRMNDTYARELMLDNLVDFVGVRKKWPTYSEKDIDIKDFIENKVAPKIHYKIKELSEKPLKVKPPRLM